MQLSTTDHEIIIIDPFISDGAHATGLGINVKS